MGALTISAVDHTTGKITITAHGLNTGDGAGAIFTGIGGVMPTGLTAASDMYAIKIDANTIKVADTSAHAFAGTALTFSDNGTLPLTFGIGLPYRRARTYAALQQIKSADLDALQDDDSALYAFLTGQPQSIYSGIVLASGQNMQLQGVGLYKRGSRVRHVPASAGVIYNGSSAVINGGYWEFTASGTTILQVPLVLEQGEQLTSVTGWVACGPTDVIQMQLFHTTGVVGGSPSDTQLGGTQLSAGHSTLIEQLVVSGLSTTVATGLETYYARFTCTARASGPFVFAVDYTTTV